MMKISRMVPYSQAVLASSLLRNSIGCTPGVQKVCIDVRVHKRNEAWPVVMKLESSDKGEREKPHRGGSNQHALTQTPCDHPAITVLTHEFGETRSGALSNEPQAILHHPTFGFASAMQQCAKIRLVVCTQVALEVCRCVQAASSQAGLGRHPRLSSAVEPQTFVTRRS